MNLTTFATLSLMEHLGGSFVQSLVQCYRCADNNNRAILRKAFAHYFDKYEKMNALSQEIEADSS